MNWGRIYYDMAREFGWTPDQVNDLTITQLSMLRNGGDDGSVLRLTPIQARMFFARHAQKKG